MKHVSPVERRIINGVIKKALGWGLTISVNDGEELALDRSGQTNAIREATGATDETIYLVYRADGTPCGWISFIHGNGEDVISDHTINDVINALVDD